MPATGAVINEVTDTALCERRWSVSTGSKARHNLALVLEEMGRTDDAEVEWRAITAERPDYGPAWRGLGELHVRTGRPELVEPLCRRLDDEPHLAGVAAVLRARVHEARGEFANAIGLLRNSLERVNGDDAPLRELCRMTFEQGRWADAGEHLGTLVARRPEDASAWHNLGMAMQCLDRGPDAERALARSLELRPDHEPTRAALVSVRRGLTEAMNARR